MDNFDDILYNAPAEGQNGQLSKEDYAAKKKAERDDVFELSDTTALDVAGDGNRFQQYLDVQAQFSRYSAVNTLLILAQKPEATRLGDFEHYKGLGGFVKPGQSAISILEPHEYTKEDGTLGTGYNIKKVFDISQVNARKMKATPAPSYDNRQLLKALVNKVPMKIIGVDKLPDHLPNDMLGENGAATDPKTGDVYVIKGMEFSDIFSAVALELAYAEAVNDVSGANDPRFTAYCASYILCKKYGVDTQNFIFEDAPGTFEMVPDITPQIIKQELSKIRDAADKIAGRIAKHRDAVQKTVKNPDAR